MTATELRPISNCKLQISFLGDFRIQYGEHAVSDMDNRAHQLWNLLAYLIIFRGRAISQEELIEALWPDNSSDNPSNALKNLAYRTRSALAAGGIPNAKELIVCRRGVYSWNNQIDCEVDVEEFERLLREASDLSTPVPTRIEKYMDALALYRGDFLPKSAFENWVIPLISYFRGLYTKGVTDAVALLWQCRRYEEIVELCQHAIVIDQFDESVHSALIKAYIALGHQQKALSHYEYVTNLFYRELGVRPSDNLRNLYREIIKTVNHVEHDLEIVKEDLREACLQLAAWGVKEVLLTLGSYGSLVLADGTFYEIPAYQPHQARDATGCGDTYVMGYVYKRVQGASIPEAACFAASVATIKLESSGPFCSTEDEAQARIDEARSLFQA